MVIQAPNAIFSSALITPLLKTWKPKPQTFFQIDLRCAIVAKI